MCEYGDQDPRSIFAAKRRQEAGTRSPSEIMKSLENPDRRISERAKDVDIIEEGHGRTDISCQHGSRWIWWDGIDGSGDWNQVVACSTCNCGTPPRPFKEEAED